ncbi:MAG: efflux RND transporter periplasmic adaptor subunit [Hyphomonadaceae bacterium]|nr:efflux RND transporter periplasmic adaptor subunit [Hyphomonadaceae bacterium]
MTQDDTPRKRAFKTPPRAASIAAGAIALGALAFFLTRGDGDAAPYRTTPVDRGAITRAVSATGQLQPLVSVDVGSTVSGLVQSVEVDFNAQVKKGQVLARIDPETFQQRVRQLQAGVTQARAQAAQARAELGRYERLAREGFASEQLLLQQQTALTSANASVSLAQAQLASAQVDLDRTTIRSPVDGVVVDRQVDPGQSVAASFQAPVLFIIAQDLSQLEAAITVDEADIGEVREDMPVRFTVDAFPDETFEGRVAQVRKQGAATSGVVSYTVIVRAENRGGRLLPGMTANAEIIVEEKPDVLRVANGALRFAPADPQLAAKAKALGGANAATPSGGGGEARQGGGGGGERRGERGGGQMLARWTQDLDLTPAQQEQARTALAAARDSAAMPGPDATPEERRAAMSKMREAAQRALDPILTPAQKAKMAELRGARGGETRVRNAVLWVLRDDRPVPVQVQLGVAADSHTEVLGGLQEGDLVITGGGPAQKEKARQQGGPGGPGGLGGPGVRVRN